MPKPPGRYVHVRPRILSISHSFQTQAGFEPKSHHARVSVVLGSNVCKASLFVYPQACLQRQTATGLPSSAVRVSYLNQLQLETCGPPAGGDARGVPFAVVSMAAPAYSVSAMRWVPSASVPVRRAVLTNRLECPAALSHQAPYRPAPGSLPQVYNR